MVRHKSYNYLNMKYSLQTLILSNKTIIGGKLLQGYFLANIEKDSSKIEGVFNCKIKNIATVP
jgi:hypothetical protein